MTQPFRSDRQTSPDAATLLAWYDRNRRQLPWRAEAGEKPDPYAVWLSEIMLQQTTVATVQGYFDAFMARWPTVYDLAAASLDEVLHAWQGLGYYARARNLHACAKSVTRDHGGVFPDTEAALRELPGIGAYTAAAIAAIAFDRPATVVDGNVERVMARAFRIEEPLPLGKQILRDCAAALTPLERPGDYAQAVMDLGATICQPRKPRCPLCPWSARCEGRRKGDAETFPRKRAKPERPTRHGTVFWLERPDGAVMLRRRAESGLLGGLLELPSSPWLEQPETILASTGASPIASTDWATIPGSVVHVFTHFRLVLTILTARVAPHIDAAGALWIKPRDFADHALPTLMKKVVRHRLAALETDPGTLL